MRKRFFAYAHTDLVGFYASAVCAVHCGLLPVVLTVSALSGLTWLANPWVEGTFILSSIVIAIFALGRNFKRHMHIRMAIQIVAVGFTLIILSRFFDGSMHGGMAAIGGMTVAAGHIVNWRLARKSVCCTTH